MHREHGGGEGGVGFELFFPLNLNVGWEHLGFSGFYFFMGFAFCGLFCSHRLWVWCDGATVEITYIGRWGVWDGIGRGVKQGTQYRGNKTHKSFAAMGGFLFPRFCVTTFYLHCLRLVLRCLLWEGGL